MKTDGEWYWITFTDGRTVIGERIGNEFFQTKYGKIEINKESLLVQKIKHLPLNSISTKKS